jgi:preprotein translocase subunit Sec61beta
MPAVILSREKRRESRSPTPPSSAGLLAFWGEKTNSVVKIRPEFAVLLAGVMILVVILATAFIPLP